MAKKKSEVKEWYVWEEANDHEGERWKVFVELTPDEVQLLKKAIMIIDDADVDQPYSLKGPIPAEHPAIVVQYTGGGYYDQFQIAIGFYANSVRDVVYAAEPSWEDVNNALYKLSAFNCP